ncbi:MAG: AMP-binding protein [Thermoleophilia bacterium]|nr:AMP-binding protein [Thermoleophilia bacterium]MDH5281017.1 AMP-binding protein [Thermoleophilia bacterium]
MKGLRIGKRRARTNGLPSSPLELALIPALTDERWNVPDRFNFTRDVVEALAHDPKRRALTVLGTDGVIEPRTFMQISEGAARWASILRERGVQPEDRVMVLAGGGLEWLEIILGVIKIGAVTVPCSPTLSAGALEVRVSSTEAALIVAEHSCQSTIVQMSFAPEVHYLDEGRQRRTSDVPDEAPTHNTSSRDLAFILSTPGSTGAAKGVAHTHGSVFATRVAAEYWLDAGRGDAVWCTASPDSPYAVWSALVGPWSRGAEVVLHQGEFDPLDRLDLLYRLGPTILCQSPAEYRALAELRELERFRSPRLRRLVSTGDYLEPEIITAFEERWGMTIHDGYGQAETNIVVANGADAGFKPGSLGRPLPGHHVAIIDTEGNELPVGIEGDLAVRGRPPTLFAGYWESPDETKSAFRGDWYLTGDVAMADEDGFLWFVGRAEDVITSRGRTFGPYEVERVLRDHSAIAASAVIGLRDLQRGGQFVRAYVVPRPGSEGTEQLEAELRQFAGQALPEQLVPREIVFVEELPIVGGRVSRHTLRERPIGGRPLWDLPPTSEPEAEAPPVTTARAAAAPAVAPTPPPVAPAPVAPFPVPVPVAPPEPTPEPVAEAAPIRAPEPVVAPERVAPPEPVAAPEPVAEAAPAIAPPKRKPKPVAAPVPLPEPVVLPEAEPVAEAARVAEPEPELVAEPKPEREPEPVAETAVEPESIVALPEPPLVPAAEVAPEREPEHMPEFTVVSAPEPEPESTPLPDVVVEPPSQPVPVQPPKPEPVAAATPEPLPDFVVHPGTTTDPHAPPPAPEPEPEPELGPLPDYVVDPNRPPEPRRPAPERPPAPTSPPLEVAGELKPETPTSSLNFPPVAAFPAPRDAPDDDVERRRDAPKAPPRRPAPDPGKSKRGKSGAAEPGDEAGEVSWMEGLSNRLSAYSLAEEDADASSAGDPAADSPESAETGT